METTLWTAASGMRAKQMNIDVIANNLSNINTQGFKRSRMVFSDQLYQNVRYPGVSQTTQYISPSGLQIGLGVNPVATQRVYDQGSLQHTGSDFDIAIKGDGFVPVLLPDGNIAYTRDGALNLDANGRVVTSQGYPILPEVFVPPEATSVNIGEDGTISITLPGQIDAQIVGQIEIGRFVNPSGLASIGGNMLLPTAASGDVIMSVPGTDGAGTIAQRYREMSNVDAVEEMVNLIAAQRAYEMNSKAIQTADAMMQTAANLKR